MSDNDFDFQLDLLVPWDIPLNSQLKPIQKEKIIKALTIFLRSLEENSIEMALQYINLALNCLGEVNISPAEIDQTKTSLKNWEVADYDTFFKVNRVKAEEPALCLVKGLLVNCRAFFLLCQASDHLDPVQIDIQKQGFASHAYLLARNFGLDI